MCRKANRRRLGGMLGCPATAVPSGDVTRASAGLWIFSRLRWNFHVKVNYHTVMVNEVEIMSEVRQQVRTLINDPIEAISEKTLDQFIGLAWDRLKMEIPYRAAALFAMSIGDSEYAREITATFSEAAVLRERERCAKIADSLNAGLDDHVDNAMMLVSEKIRSGE